MTELDIYKDRKPANFGPTIGDSLLVEVAEHLKTFAETGEPHIIDLTSLPMTDADRKALDERLGTGEVKAEIAVIGDSELWETAYAGVWRVRHFGSTRDRAAADQIVIASVPEILRTHREDARAAASRLDAELSNPHSQDALNA